MSQSKSARWLKSDFVTSNGVQVQLDDLLIRYFGVTEPALAAPAAVDAGIERALVDLGQEHDRGKRFAIWSMLYLLGRAPDIDVAFDHEGDRDAARNLMDLLAASEQRVPSQ